MQQLNDAKTINAGEIAAALEDIASAMRSLNQDRNNVLGQSYPHWTKLKELHARCMTAAKAEAAQLTLMAAFYRCPECGTRWDHVDEFAEDEDCQGCDRLGVSPFYCTHPSEVDQEVITRSLAAQEHEHPVALEYGNYVVPVQRVAYREADMNVFSAIGPATAAQSALELASHLEFPSEQSYEMTAGNGHEFTPRFRLGQTYKLITHNPTEEITEVTLRAVSGEKLVVEDAEHRQFEVLGDQIQP